MSENLTGYIINKEKLFLVKYAKNKLFLVKYAKNTLLHFIS
jgi:hypothetical protein